LTRWKSFTGDPRRRKRLTLEMILWETSFIWPMTSAVKFGKVRAAPPQQVRRSRRVVVSNLPWHPPGNVSFAKSPRLRYRNQEIFTLFSNGLYKRTLQNFHMSRARKDLLFSGHQYCIDSNGLRFFRLGFEEQYSSAINLRKSSNARTLIAHRRASSLHNTARNCAATSPMRCCPLTKWRLLSKAAFLDSIYFRAFS
jgi:hypothetical protein